MSEKTEIGVDLSGCYRRSTEEEAVNSDNTLELDDLEAKDLTGVGDEEKVISTQNILNSGKSH